MQPTENSSLYIFKKFLRRSPSGQVQSDLVLSKECYDLWVKKRLVRSTIPHESFRKILTAHIRGSEGRKPFEEDEERSLLIELRKKRVWPCFKNNKSKIGINGFRARGYHESRKNEESDLSKDSQMDSCKGSTAAQERHVSSYEVFVQYALLQNKNGDSMILSRECFESWVTSRRHGCKKPEFSFRKALMAHLCGKDGRRPFPAEIETLILDEIRKRRTWPCFVHRREKAILNIGKKGFKKHGYHEESGDDSDREESLPAANLRLKRKRVVEEDEDQCVLACKIENINLDFLLQTSDPTMKRLKSEDSDVWDSDLEDHRQFDDLLGCEENFEDLTSSSTCTTTNGDHIEWPVIENINISDKNFFQEMLEAMADPRSNFCYEGLPLSSM